MSKEAMKLALDALEGMAQDSGKFPAEIPAIKALQFALAEQPAQQEPVAWAHKQIKATLAAFGPGEAISMTKETWAKLHKAMKTLAEQPAQRKPLTDEQLMEMWRTTKFRGNGGQVDWFIEGTRAAEAAHGIKEQP